MCHEFINNALLLVLANPHVTAPYFEPFSFEGGGGGGMVLPYTSYVQVPLPLAGAPWRGPPGGDPLAGILWRPLAGTPW